MFSKLTGFMLLCFCSTVFGQTDRDSTSNTGLSYQQIESLGDSALIRVNTDIKLNTLRPDTVIKPHSKPEKTSGKRSKPAGRILNINFGMAPKDSPPQGVIGESDDVWTLVDVGETSKTQLPMADGTPTDVTLTLSENDGEWGIPGVFDVYHAYLYHNCRCVDLAVTLTGLPEGVYAVYVFAHGDAPAQNASIVIQSGQTTYSGEKTLNDGSYRYRDREFEEGNQYVKYLIEVHDDTPIKIISQRDGSSLSMFNAIQLKKLKVK